MNKERESKVDEPYAVEAETPPVRPGEVDTVTAGLETEIEEHLAMPRRKRFSFLKKGPLSKKEKITFVSAIAVILAVGGGLLWWMNSQSLGDATTLEAAKTQKFYSPLNGVQVADEAATKRAVTAVMIENSPDARPQSGLAEADVVFEAVAEGGITRFIALYQPSRPATVGPVRSLRPYYVEWAAAFAPSVAHVGGSPEALTMIRSGEYGTDIDQFFNSTYYQRVTDRAAPHNVYTGFDQLDELNASKNHTSSDFSFAPRKDAKAVATPDASRIDIQVSTGQFAVSYDYNTTNNSYDRKQGGGAHLDREKGQISPKVVVALKTNVALSSDGSHMNVTTAGNGTAYVFQNGTIAEGTWSKADAKSQLYIKDKDGKELSLVRGQTWITVVGNDRSVTWQ